MSLYFPTRSHLLKLLHSLLLISLFLFGCGRLAPPPSSSKAGFELAGNHSIKATTPAEPVIPEVVISEIVERVPLDIAPIVLEPATPALNLIAYRGSDRNLYAVAPDGSNRVALTDDAVISRSEVIDYTQITWLPNSEQIGFVRVQVEESGSAAALMMVEPAGGPTQTVFESDELYPFYLFWAPNSQTISFLSNIPGANTLGLFLASVSSDDEPNLVQSGQPLYWAWSPDSEQIMTHTGGSRQGQLALIDPSLQGDDVELDLNPTAFQAPSWSPDGARVLLALEDDELGDTLVSLDENGMIEAEIATFDERANFVLSPDGTRVAYIEGDALRGVGSVGALTILDLNQPTEDLIVDETLVLAFFWSPDGSKILYFSLDKDGKQQAKLLPTLQEGEPAFFLDVHVLSLDTGSAILIDSIAPTEAFLNIIPYFDQYHRSSTFWSPDSTAFVVAAHADSGGEHILVYEAAGGVPPTVVGEGSIAYWSWR